MRSRSELRCRLKSGSVSTRTQSGSKPLRRNSRNINSVSVELSSAMSIFSRSDISSAQMRRLVKHKPVHTDFAHRFRETIEIHGLHDIAVHSKMIAFHDVALLL